MEQTHTALACSPFPALDTAAPPWDCLLRIEATMSLCPSPCVGVCRHAYPSGCSCCTYYKLQKDMLKTTVTSPEPYWNSDWTETMTQKKKDTLHISVILSSVLKVLCHSQASQACLHGVWQAGGTWKQLVSNVFGVWQWHFFKKHISWHVNSMYST